MSGSDFGQIENSSPSTPANESSASLEARYAELQSKVGEERFLWSVVVVLLVDLLMFERFGTWAAPVCITIVEVIFFVVLARKCRVPDITMLLDRVTDFYAPHRKDPQP